MSSSNTTSAQKEITTSAAPAPAHSQGLSVFLAQLSGAYQSDDPTEITNAQNSLIGALKSEKKIETKRVEVKKDSEFAESFLKTLSVDENEIKIKSEINPKTKSANADVCCRCGDCDYFKEKNIKSS